VRLYSSEMVKKVVSKMIIFDLFSGLFYFFLA